MFMVHPSKNMNLNVNRNTNINVHKKQRGLNFAPDERTLLIKIANKYKHVIENKKTDGVTWRAKEECWNSLEQEFNSISSGPERTAKQLKMKYEGVKKDIKRKYYEHKAFLEGTGDGKPRHPPIPCSEAEKELTETIILSLQGLKNLQDSDNENTNGSFSTKEDSLDKTDVICEWGKFPASILQTEIHPVQQIKIEENKSFNTTTGTTTTEENNYCDNSKDYTECETENSNEDQSCTCKRKEFNKKRSQSDVDTFDELTSKKGKLVDILIKNAEHQNVAAAETTEKFNKQMVEEHIIKMSILRERQKQEELRTELLRYEVEIAKLNLMKFMKEN